ncbi:uncharacterized protein LOC143625303 [Bidens hawaiensis]|uniref:uncharacterized protein LOC143625303 n=1 Tax=Bidens hawaiensis TaxID=980011 RepID=UPI00404B0F58
MVSPAQVPARQMFKSLIPSLAQSFISDIKNVRPDGNCGFRAISVGLGMHEKYWADVRWAMLIELETNEWWWRAMFKKEDDKIYDRLRSSLPYYTTVKPAPPRNWFSVPALGHLAAQTYGCVLINLHGNETECYFSLRIGPGTIQIQWL